MPDESIMTTCLCKGQIYTIYAARQNKSHAPNAGGGIRPYAFLRKIAIFEALDGP